MATGAWVGGRTGISQRLERKNYADSYSHLRLVLSPLTSTQEHFEARELHSTHWGRFCPAETPEGPTIGLRKHLALFAEITKGLTINEKKKVLSLIKTDKEGYDIYLDGVPLGKIQEPIKLIEDLRRKRFSNQISREINFSYYPKLKEVRINTDPGRVRRPLIVVENGKSKLLEEQLRKLEKGELHWQDLQKLGIVEYLDAEEEDNTLVALNEKDLTTSNTHLELMPLAVLGLSASLVVFPEHNRGDRVNYGAKMIGQAIGIYQTNYHLRTDTKSNILVYPQVPLVETDTVPVVGLNHHPAGQNVVVAVISYKGYNMEDAVIFNKSSIDRGLLRSFFFRVYPSEEKRYWGGQKDKIAIPDKDVRGYRSEEDYSRLA
jgi:DNA-directed RNA polymerase subunit B